MTGDVAGTGSEDEILSRPVLWQAQVEQPHWSTLPFALIIPGVLLLLAAMGNLTLVDDTMGVLDTISKASLVPLLLIGGFFLWRLWRLFSFSSGIFSAGFNLYDRYFTRFEWQLVSGHLLIRNPHKVIVWPLDKFDHALVKITQLERARLEFVFPGADNQKKGTSRSIAMNGQMDLIALSHVLRDCAMRIELQYKGVYRTAKPLPRPDEAQILWQGRPSWGVLRQFGLAPAIFLVAALIVIWSGLEVYRIGDLHNHLFLLFVFAIVMLISGVKMPEALARMTSPVLFTARHICFIGMASGKVREVIAMEQVAGCWLDPLNGRITLEVVHPAFPTDPVSLDLPALKDAETAQAALQQALERINRDTQG